MNLLVIGPSRAGKTTLALSFAHHYLAKTFEEERLELLPDNVNNIDHQTKTSYIYSIGDETNKICLLDTPGVSAIDPAEAAKEIGQIFDGIVDVLLQIGTLHGAILVINPVSRRDLVLEEYVRKLMSILPNVKNNFYVICTRNSGEVEQEIKETISKLLKFDLEDEKWFAVDNKCMRSYKTFKPIDLEVFEEYWKEGQLAFRSILGMISSSKPLSTSYLEAYKQQKEKVVRLIQLMNLKREEMFQKLGEKVNTPRTIPIISKSKKTAVQRDKKAWSCKGCKHTCSSRTYLTYILGMLGRIFPFSWLASLVFFSWIFSCLQCKCLLSKHVDIIDFPEAESLISHTTISLKDSHVDLQALIEEYLGPSLEALAGLFRSDFYDILYDLYMNNLQSVTQTFMEKEPSKDLRGFFIKAIDAEKKYFMYLMEK